MKIDCMKWIVLKLYSAAIVSPLMLMVFRSTSSLIAGSMITGYADKAGNNKLAPLYD